MEGHTRGVNGVAVTPDGTRAITTSSDATARVWDLATGATTLTLKGHTNWVQEVAVTPDGTHAITTSDDRTVRVWDLATGLTTRTLEGHTRGVNGVAVTPDGTRAITTSSDATARVWDLATGATTRTLEGHTDRVRGVAVTPDGTHVITVAVNGVLRVWAWAAALTGEFAANRGARYTNAKVVLVGEQGAGKSGLALVLAGRPWVPTASTVGAWATQFLLPRATSDDGVEREIWLWDFGGQADQRLIHQLFLKEAQLALLVFDGQRDDVVERVSEWTRAIAPPGHDIPKVLVAARVDSNQVLLNRADIAQLRQAAGSTAYLETSARTGKNIEALRDAVAATIDWSRVPEHSSPEVFRRLKAAVLRFKDRGRVLTTVKELLNWLPVEVGAFSEAELTTVIRLLEGPGAVTRLGFDDQVLLRPDLLNTYGQAVIRSLADDPDERGCLPEQRLLEGDLNYPPGFERLDRTEETTLLRGLQRELVDRALCIRDVDPSDRLATLLVFPSYFRRQRPDRPTEPQVFTTYTFDGPLDEIYSSLVVRLHHTTHFDSKKLWRDVAELRSNESGQAVGVRLRRQPDRSGCLDLFADPGASRSDRQILTRFTHEHLNRHATEVQRYRVYTCQACGHVARDTDLVARKIREGAARIRCQNCGQLIDLVDDLEREFGSPELRDRVIEQERRAQEAIDRATRLQTMVFDVMATVARAGQRPTQVGRPFPGVEITFVDDDRQPSDRQVFVHLDPDTRHDTDAIDLNPDWAKHPTPILYGVQGPDEGTIHTMDLSDALRKGTAGATRNVPFDGRRFDVAAVLALRERLL
ncbi:MAG: GTP-binding protein [Kineosporiaceae bacterium]